MADKGYVNPGLVWTPQQLRERIGERKSDDLVIIDTRPAPVAAFTWMLAYLREALEAFLKRDAAVINDQPYKDRRGKISWTGIPTSGWSFRRSSDDS